MSTEVLNPHAAALTILLVDDEAPIREIFSMFLAERGHRVTCAPDGEVALREYNNSQFDVVVTDRMMPNLDGVGLARAIKKQNPHQPIVMISGRPPDEQGGDLGGIDCFVRKPFTMAMLDRAIQEAMARHAQPA